MFNGFYLTYKGQEYIAKALTGKTLSITRGQFGNGSIGSGIPNERTSLVSPRGDLIISKKEVSGNRLTITTQFSNRVNGSILPAFYLTEAGIYGKVLNADGTTDSAETLIAYACEEQAESDHIKQVLTEFVLNWSMVISSEADVQVVIDESLAYVSLEDYNRISRTGTLEVLRGTNYATSNLSEEKGMVGLSIYGKSVQDGTPTPIAPIEIVNVENPTVAVCGVNLWDEETEYGYWQSANGEAYSADNQIRSKNIISIIPNSTIYVTAPNDKTIDFVFYDRNKSYLSSRSIAKEVTSPDNAYYMHINLRSDYGTTYNNDVCISLIPLNGAYKATAGNQALATSYTLRGIPVSSGGNYTDADGQQWICDEVDLERGVLKQWVGYRRILGTDISSVSVEDDGTVLFRVYLKTPISGHIGYSEGFCDKYEVKTSYSEIHSHDDYAIGINGSGHLIIKDSNLSTKDEMAMFIDAYTITIAYALSSPVEIPLFGGTLTWYGEINGRDSVPMNGDGSYDYIRLVHVSDVVPTMEELQQGVSCYVHLEEEGGGSAVTAVDKILRYTAEDLVDQDNCISPATLPYFVIAKEDNVTCKISGGTVLPKKGIYLIHVENNGYAEWLSIHNYKGTPLSDSRLPDDILKTHYPATNIFVTDGMDIDFEAKIRTRSYANSKYISDVLEYLKHKS